MKKNLIAYTLLVLIILATSCAVIKPYSVPEMKTQGLYRDQSSLDTTNMASMHWTEVFQDTLLQNLVEEGIAHNLNLEIAFSRIQQAQAYYEQSRQVFLPNISADASVQQAKLSNNKTTTSTTNTTTYQLGVNANW